MLFILDLSNFNVIILYLLHYILNYYCILISWWQKSAVNLKFKYEKSQEFILVSAFIYHGVRYNIIEKKRMY